MRARVIIAALTLSLALAGPTKSENQPAAANPVDQLAWLIGGTWTADGDNGPDGKAFHVETVFNWAANHRGIIFTTRFRIDGKLVPVYEGLYAWHPAQKKFNFLYTDNEGAMTSGAAAWLSDTLEQDFQIVEPDGTAKTFHSTVKRTGPNQYDWNVRHQDKEGAWVPMFALTYTRKPA